MTPIFIALLGSYNALGEPSYTQQKFVESVIVREVVPNEPKEPGFELIEPKDYRVTMTEFLTAKGTPNGEYTVVIADPPNLPTQKVFKHDFRFTPSAKIVRDIKVTVNGQLVHRITVQSSAELTTLTSVSDVRLWKQTSNLVPDGVPEMPPFQTLGTTGQCLYTSKSFQAWMDGNADLKKVPDDNWMTYFQKAYGVFGNKWDYSKSPAIGTFDLDHILKSRNAGCSSASLVLTGALRSQNIPTIQVYGGYVSPRTAAHAFNFSKLDPYGWKLLDPTRALGGDSAVVPPEYFFVHHVIQGGSMENPLRANNMLLASTDAHHIALLEGTGILHVGTNYSTISAVPISLPKSGW